MIRKGIRPRFRLGFDLPGQQNRFRRELPFKRTWVAIIILAIFDIVFLIPAITTFQQAVELWTKPDDLFNLVAALFITFWLVGWSVAPLLMTAILAFLLFGREVITANPGRVDQFFGVPFLGLWVQYDPAKMRNLRLEIPAKKSGKSWRGPHGAFDYGANTGEFGSNLSETEVARIKNQIEMAAGTTIRSGDATDADLQGDWAPDKLTSALGDTPQEAVTLPKSQAAPVTLASPSSLILIIANLVPVVGAVFWNWDLGHVLVLYWAESAIIGFYNLCKIIVIGKYLAILAGPFFLAHFGAFMAVHFLFIYTIFIKGPEGWNSGTELGDVAKMFAALAPALIALFLSHGYSFLVNFLGRKEHASRTIQTQMSEPYGRIIFMHLVIIFGGGLALVLGEPTPVLIIVIALKIWFDLRSHLKQREKG